MIQTYFINKEQLNAMKDYIVRSKKDWSIDYGPMETSSNDKYPEITLYSVKIEGEMNCTDAFHFGLLLAQSI
jgi:hypothetical protein